MWRIWYSKLKRMEKMAKKKDAKKAVTGKKTKRCKHCKTKIKSNAKVCPNCGKKQGGILKWILIGFIVILLFGLIYSIGNGSDSQPKSTNDKPSDVNEENNTQEVPTESKNEYPLGFHVSFRETYPNDVTGNWRLAMISEDINIEEYALNYYTNYFEADTEVHIIVNFTLNVTTRITVIGDLLDITTTEYVDNEENDAKIACSGMLLSKYHVNIDSGEIEKIQ